MSTVEGRWGKISFYDQDEYVGKSLLHYGEYNPDETESLVHLAGQPRIGGVVLDVGANFGCLGQALEAHGHTVISFEPQPDIFQMLRLNVKGEAHNIGLGATNCTAQMPRMPENVNANYGGISLNTTGPLGSVEVQVRTLDSFNYQDVYLVKIDVEGYEEQVLRGGEQTIRRCMPILYVEDDRQEKSASLRAYIRSLGYSIEEHRPMLYRENNFFGLKKNIWGANYASYNTICRPIREAQLPVPTPTPQNKWGFAQEAVQSSNERDYRAAEEQYRQALLLGEDYTLQYCMSIVQLHNGKIKEGFYNYGLRWANSESTPHMMSMLSKGVPYVGDWDDLVGKRLFISGEQGLGDEIMFSRVLAPASKVCTSMAKLTPQSLLEFFAINCTGLHLLPEKLNTLPKDFIKDNFDCIISIGDLFRLYVLKFGELPPLPQYKCANPVDGSQVVPRVGFVYSPGNMGDSSAARAVDPKVFKRFETDADWFSFQVGLPPVVGTDLSAHISTFADTANLLSGMDCVVTCDTAFAHLSLCMGKPTLLVYNSYVDWRFKIGLYPAVQLLSTYDYDFSNKLRKFISTSGAR